MTTDDSFDFTDLGEKLRGPEGPELAAGVIARLRQLQEEAKKRGDSGLSPADFARNTALSDALAAAEDVMVGISTVTSGPASPGPRSEGN